MESGFGQNLEGFLIKGNISLAPSANPILQGDGSIEGSGTLYIDTINEYNSTNGVTIQDVSFNNGKVLVPYNLQSDNITSASVVINGGVSIGHTQNAKNTTSGGGLTIAGGVGIGKDLHVGGIVNVNGNKIKNVATPQNGTDGVNKDYVDSVADRVSGDFLTGQVIIGASDGDAIRGYSFLTTDTNTLNLSIPFILSNPSPTAFVCYGGISIDKNVFIGDGLDVNNKRISNVAVPILGTDAVNKDYIQDLFDNFTTGNVVGNFTSGQVIIADTSGNSIKGFNNLTFNSLDGTNGTLLIIL